MYFRRNLESKATGLPRGTVAVIVVGVALILSSCGKQGTQEITDTRTVSQSPAATPTAGVGKANMPMTTPAASYAWAAPESWQALPATSTRMANFKVDADSDAECYLTVLSGTGGGMEANVNRWRAQLSLEPYTPDEISKLPTIEVLGQNAPLMEFEGTYKGMGNSENKEGYKLLGIILEDKGNAVFVKMTGPSAVVDREKDNFVAFCQSLKPAATQTATALPEGHPDMSAGTMPGGTQQNMQLPQGHPDISNTQGIAPGMGGNSSVGITSWAAPDGWTQAPDKPMRTVTFTMGDDGKTECYVTSLSGPAGGVEANINRWRQQMGQAPLDGTALAELPTITILGKPSPMIKIKGDFTGMSGEGGSSYELLGAICPLDSETIFVKMTGPASEVDANKDKFIAFCESLQ